jgi:DNA-binding XRE family transcriptional regulator
MAPSDAPCRTQAGAATGRVLRTSPSRPIASAPSHNPVPKPRLLFVVYYNTQVCTPAHRNRTPVQVRVNKVPLSVGCRVRKAELERRKAATAAELKEWERTIGAMIAASRKARKITQQGLADEIGWSRNQVANLEHGRANVRVGHLIVIAKAVGEQPEKLFSRILHFR